MPDGYHIASAWVDVKPDLDGFAEELKAKLDAVTSGDGTNARVGVNQGYLDAALAIAKAKIDAFAAQNRDLNIGVMGNVAGLAGVETALGDINDELITQTGLLADVSNQLHDMRDDWLENAAAASAYRAAADEAGSNAAQGWYGPYGIIGGLRAANRASLTLFGGAFGTVPMLGAIGGLHLLVDGIAEFAAVVVPAAIAATAWGVAASDAVRAVYTQVTDMHTAMDSAGQSMAPFTGQLEKLHQAVTPAVFQLAGDAIEVMAHNTGAFQSIVMGTNQVVQQLGDRLTVALSSSGWHVFIANAVTDFAKLSDIVANLGGVFGNFLRAIPGYAQDLLSVADAASKVTEAISGLLVHPLPGLSQGLLGAGLAFHGFAIYAGLAGTAVAKLISSGLGAVATLAGNAGLRMASFGGVAEKAGGALTKFAGAADSAAGLPWGWIAIAAAGVGLLVYELTQVKDATQQWIDSMQAAVGKMSAGGGLTPLIDAQAQVTTRLSSANQQLAQTMNNATAANVVQRRETNASQDAYLQQVTAVKELSGAQVTGAAGIALYKTRVDELAQSMHVSTATVVAFLRQAGIPYSQILSKNAEQLAEVKAAIQATIDAYGLMGVKSGELGADVQTLNYLVSDQYKAVSGLNSAWDQMATIVTGSQTSFDTWALSMKGLNIAAQGVGNTLSVTNGRTSASISGATQAAGAINKQAVSFDGLSKASLQYNQTLEQTLPQMVSILDSLRLANLGTGTYKTAVQDLVTQYLPYVKNNQTLLGQLVALSGGAIPDTVTSYQQLVQWLGNSSDSTQTLHDKEAQLKQIMDEATQKTDGMTQAIQQQADTITSQLLGAQDQMALGYYKIQQKADQYFQDVLSKSPNLTRDQNTLNQSIIQMGQNMDWGTGRTARMIAEIEKIPLSEAIKIVMTGKGSYSISGGGIYPTPSGKNTTAPVGTLTGATGGAVSGPGTSTSDSIPAYLSDGEYVIRADSVAQYGQGFFDAVNAGMYAGGGLVTGNAAVVSGQYADTIVGAFQNAMVTSMVNSMKGAISSAGAMSFPGGGSSGPGATAAQSYARSILGLYGWGANQMNYLIPLWNQESGWRWNATNPSSGAYGIPQSLPADKMAAAGPDWRTNPATQIRWGLGYIKARYGSPAGAEAHEQSAGWYHRGGLVRRASGGPVMPAMASSTPQPGEYCSVAEHGKTKGGLVCKQASDGSWRWEHPSGPSSTSTSHSSTSASSEHTAGSSLMNFYLSPQTTAALMKEQTKFLEDIATYYKGPARKWRDTMVEHQTASLIKVEGELKSLNSKIQAAKSFQSSVQGGLASYAGLSGLDPYGNLLVPGTQPGQSAGQGLESQLKLSLANLKKWQADIKALQRAKVSPALISQVVQMGPQTGMQYAEAILAGGHSLISEMNKTESQLGAVEKSTAHAATKAVYGQSVASMWKDDADLKKAAQLFGREMAKEAAKWFRVPGNQQPPVVQHFHGSPSVEERLELRRDLALVLGI